MKKRLIKKEELIEFLMWLSVEKKFPLDVKDVERYLAVKEMCELMCPGGEHD